MAANNYDHDDPWGNNEASSGSPNSIPKTIGEVQEICNRYLDELREIVKIPSSFALTSLLGFISFLSCLAYSKNMKKETDKDGILSDGEMFQAFVRKYMWRGSQSEDEIKALYSVLRCGLAHSMSFCDRIDKFYKDERKQNYPSREACRQELISNENELRAFHEWCARDVNLRIVNHSKYCRKTQGEYTLCPSVLFSDVEKATKYFFDRARNEPQLESQIREYVCIQPPIVPSLKDSFIQKD